MQEKSQIMFREARIKNIPQLIYSLYLWVRDGIIWGLGTNQVLKHGKVSYYYFLFIWALLRFLERQKTCKQSLYFLSFLYSIYGFCLFWLKKSKMKWKYDNRTENIWIAKILITLKKYSSLFSESQSLKTQIHNFLTFYLKNLPVFIHHNQSFSIQSKIKFQ